MGDPTAERNRSQLTLGWKVNGSLSPTYWLDPSAKAGQQATADLEHVKAESMGCHTAIVAQSGSGKSFLLGRLIEEILVETRARCVILDPNADFRSMFEVVSPDLWKSAKYDNRKLRGALPHEADSEEFRSKWDRITKRIRGGPGFKNRKGKPLRIEWPFLSVEFLLEDAPPEIRPDLYHCHEFVKAIWDLLEEKERANREGESKEPVKGRRARNPAPDVIDEARRILGRARYGGAAERREALEMTFPEAPIVAAVKDVPTGALPVPFKWHIFFAKTMHSRRIERAAAAIDYISAEAERFYFGKAKEYVAQGLVESKIRDGDREEKVPARLEIVDLPSFRDTRSRLLGLYGVLDSEWKRAYDQWAEAVRKPESEDTRVPTFIIVDEAHNLVPVEPQGLADRALRDQFRKIAAEGRKFGMFLILCTQRPDKIDPLVTSECENRAIMRVGSRAVLQTTTRLLGLEDVPETQLNRCLEFETGRVLLVGRWAGTAPRTFYVAMRRTLEGGRNLRDDHWATPEPSAVVPIPGATEAKPPDGGSSPKS